MIKLILPYLPVHLIYSRPSSPRSPAVTDDQELVVRGVWDLNCLQVTARRTLQAAIVFLTKTVGKNVLMSVGAI